MDLARAAGLVWLLFFLTALPGGVLLGTFREAGTALSLFSTACYIALTALLYELLSPVDRSTALVAAFLSLVACALTAVATLLQTSPNTELADLGRRGVALSFVFFGFFMIATGSLIVRSTFLPHALGALFVVAGVGWVMFLIPPVVRVLQGGIVALGVAAEVTLMLWLLIRGVDV